jgi:hypothetical protein
MEVMAYITGVLAYVTIVRLREDKERCRIVSEVQSEETVKTKVIKWSS